VSTFTFDEACDRLADLLIDADLFFGHGAPDADSEAFWILAHCVGISPIDALDRLEETYPPLAFDRAQLIVNERIKSKKPLAYILGEAWLIGYDFICDERSIVPRSYIAELIAMNQLEPWLPPSGRALDLCTGNGSLAILLSLHCPDLLIQACDLSPDALALAAENVDKYQLSNAIELFCGDLFEALPLPSELNTFDLIICNPPYVNQESLSQLPSEYLNEPAIALDGGIDGMDLVRRIFTEAKDYLKPEGALILEIGNEYKNFIKAFPELQVRWLDVSAGSEQVLVIQAGDL
jgi:ribosomal protein L3 glutamine methyltransferase